MLRYAVPDSKLRAFLLQDLVRDATNFRWRVRFDATEANMDAIMGFPPRLIHSSATPALLVSGSHSEYVDDKGIVVLRTMYRFCEHAVIPDAGH